MKLGEFCSKHHLGVLDEIIIKEYDSVEDRFETVGVINRDSTINILSQFPNWDLELIEIISGEHPDDPVAEEWNKFILVVNKTYRKE